MWSRERTERRKLDLMDKGNVNCLVSVNNRPEGWLPDLDVACTSQQLPSRCWSKNCSSLGTTDSPSLHSPFAQNIASHKLRWSMLSRTLILSMLSNMTVTFLYDLYVSVFKNRVTCSIVWGREAMGDLVFDLLEFWVKALMSVWARHELKQTYCGPPVSCSHGAGCTCC